MKNLKDVLKKPILTWSLIGALGLSTFILAFKNNGFEKQNNYFFNTYSEVGERYSKLAHKYSKAIEDSMKIETEHFLKSVSLKGDNLRLAEKLDSLQKEYVSFAENLTGLYLKLDYEIDSLQENYIDSSIDLFEKINLIKNENSFLKKYNHYLDSLLLKCESNSIFPDKR